jgi:hypothetical protein
MACGKAGLLVVAEVWFRRGYHAVEIDKTIAITPALVERLRNLQIHLFPI